MSQGEPDGAGGGSPGGGGGGGGLVVINTVVILKFTPIIRGNPSGCDKPPVDSKTKVHFNMRNLY